MTAIYLNELINDHYLIEKALVILEKQTEKGENLNFSMVKTLLDFLWDYGDKCHNMKEEKAYFPLLFQRGMPQQGPIGVMLQEHEEERHYIELLKSQIDIREKTNNLPDDFAKNVNVYLEITKNHIWKENDILYPMGKNFLTPDDEISLAPEFKKIERESAGEGAFERYTALIESLEKEAGGRVDLLASVDTEVIGNMLDALPIELSFVDENDRVKYFNKLDKEKIFVRSLSVIGRTVQQCHPPKSVHMVNQIIKEMKEGTRDDATFWINFEGKFLHISYYAVRNNEGNYQGCIEMVQDVNPYRQLQGEKRLLDEN